jgi:hypothetical protein
MYQAFKTLRHKIVDTLFTIIIHIVQFQLYIYIYICIYIYLTVISVIHNLCFSWINKYINEDLNHDSVQNYLQTHKHLYNTIQSHSHGAYMQFYSVDMITFRINLEIF